MNTMRMLYRRTKTTVAGGQVTTEIVVVEIDAGLLDHPGSPSRSEGLDTDQSTRVAAEGPAASAGFDRFAADYRGGLVPRELCPRWTGPADRCTTCGVAAYDHQRAPTPAQRGCERFAPPGHLDGPPDSRTTCDFCSLPARDHATGDGS